MPPEEGDYQTHIDQDEIILQRFGGDSTWHNQARILQTPSGSNIELIGDSSKVFIDQESITLFEKQGTQFFPKTVLENGKIKTYDEFNRINASWGDTVPGGFSPTVKVPQTTFTNQSITGDTLFNSLNSKISILNKKIEISGGGTRTGFKGAIISAEKTSSTVFKLYCFDFTGTQNSVSFDVTSGDSSVLFTNCTLAF